MNKLDQRVLQRFRGLTREGDYLMIDFHEIAKELAEFDVDTPDIKDSVDRLEYKNLIRVKYIDTDECCLTVTPKSRVAKKELFDADVTVKSIRWQYFAFSFLGGILSGSVFMLIYSLFLR